MDENPKDNPAASGVKTDPGTESYELDLDENATADIDEAFKDAVAAVDRSKDATEAPRASEDPEEADSTDEPAHEQLASEANGLRERLMRTLADFDNYRKRTEREKQSLRRFANFDVFKDFLGVLDNFERAMDSSGSTDDLKQGLKMIVRQQEEILKRHGVQKIEAVGKPFDPTVHEAVAREESADVESPMVTKEMQRGYLLHDRLLRPALVFVAMPARQSATAGEDAGGEAETASE